MTRPTPEQRSQSSFLELAMPTLSAATGRYCAARWRACAPLERAFVDFSRPSLTCAATFRSTKSGLRARALDGNLSARPTTSSVDKRDCLSLNPIIDFCVDLCCFAKLPIDCPVRITGESVSPKFLRGLCNTNGTNAQSTCRMVAQTANGRAKHQRSLGPCFREHMARTSLVANDCRPECASSTWPVLHCVKKERQIELLGWTRCARVAPVKENANQHTMACSK
mmetsp:Transcript_13424/g.42798  ORF Transcript_13424/g.42798 Transcript_13424/m.42798 type:complete len:224 (+) Transcript_13424:186-857(+)